MTPEQFEAFMAHMATLDRRLSNMERDSSDSAAAIEELSRNMANLADSSERLKGLYLDLGTKVDGVEAMVGNYVQATKDLRNDARILTSTVRERLKVPGA